MGESGILRGPGSLAAALAEELRARMNRGELQPGDRLPGERELAGSLGVHRGSLREALRELELLRLVATRRGSGTRVLDPQHASFELIGEQLARDPAGGWLDDLLELRELIARGAVRRLLATHRGASAAISDVSRALDAIASSRLPQSAFAEAVWGLPAYLARASGNQVFLLLANSATRFLSTHVLAVADPRHRRALASALHRLARALDARDADRAERAARDLGRLTVWRPRR
jgi:GntR family transcriptional repressor for pyruvate dehydrogenase complex